MYIWFFEESYPNKLVGEYDRENSPDSLIFWDTKILNLKEVPIVVFEGKKEELLVYDDLENNGGVKIVSPRLADTLKKYGKDDIEFVDVVLRALDGDIVDYKIVHFIKEVEALNYEKSEIKYLPNTNEEIILRIRKLKLIEDKLGDANIALLTERKSFILISELLKKQIKNFKGVSLYKDEEISIQI